MLVVVVLFTATVIVLGVFLYESGRPALLSCGVRDFRAILNITPWPANRAKLVRNFNSSASGLVYFEGSGELETGDSDTTLLFHQNSLFAYVSGLEVPSLVLVLELEPGNRLAKSLLFVKAVDEQWQGENLSLEQWKADGQVDEAFWIEALVPYLVANSGKTLFSAPQFNVPSNWTGPIDTIQLPLASAVSRLSKTDPEVALLRSVAVAASNAHNNLMRAM